MDFVFWHHVNFLGLQAIMEGQLSKLVGWSAYVPKNSYLQKAHFCSCLTWFLSPGHSRALPSFEISMPTSRPQLLMQYRIGCHPLSLEQDRLGRPTILWLLRCCALCSARALGDERHFFVDCSSFAHTCCQILPFSQNADGTMHCFL